MLSGKSTDLKQQLECKQFPDFVGFGDISLTEQNGFEIINAAKSFIENSRTGSAHWIYAANLQHSRPTNHCCKKPFVARANRWKPLLLKKVPSLLWQDSWFYF